MAAPTNVSAEASAIDSIDLYWDYSGSNGINVYKSSDGSSYTLVTTTTDTDYTVTDLDSGTKYWFKLSDDLGSTFSSVVTAVTHVCSTSDGTANELGLPRFTGDNQQSGELNDMAQRIEDALNDRVLTEGECPVCPEENAIVLDCSSGCTNFVVVVDEDINSITLKGCDDGLSGTIDFIIPPNEEPGICGWPPGFGFTGDECRQAKVNGGTDGRTVSVGFGSTRGGKGNTKARQDRTKSKKGYGGGGVGGISCVCNPGKNGQLAIKSCNANNSLDCSGAKSLKLIACGGRPPYSWSNTGSITVTASGLNSERATVTPPTNSGTGVAGVAYVKVIKHCALTGSGGACTPGGGESQQNRTSWRQYGCDDLPENSCTTSVDNAGPEGCTNSGTDPVLCKNGACNSQTCSSGDCSGSRQYQSGSSPCTEDATLGGAAVCDERTAGMISNGCSPCGLQAGSTVTVEDAVGNTVSIVVRA